MTLLDHNKLLSGEIMIAVHCRICDFVSYTIFPDIAYGMAEDHARNVLHSMLIIIARDTEGARVAETKLQFIGTVNQ